MPYVIECKTGNPRHRSHYLQVIFVEIISRASGVQVNRTQDCARNQERNAKHGTYTQFSESSDLTEGCITRDVADNQADTIAPNALYHGAAHADRVARPSHTGPGNRTTQ